MCGIFGYVARDARDPKAVVEGLRYLEYRGYDSWGIAVQERGAVRTEKATGPISAASSSLPASPSALGHTRWATHGGVTEANAHPHTDCASRFALIHNGIVENYSELSGRLRPGHRFLSQTDTEVLVHLLEETVEREPDVLQALLTVFRQVEGLSAVAVLDGQTSGIAVAKNGSPVAIGWADGACYIASDAAALLDHTTRVTFLDDGQAASLTVDGAEIVRLRDGDRIVPAVRELTREEERAGLNGHSHFLAKEIHEQPEVLTHLAAVSEAGVETLAAMIGEAQDVSLIGCGTAHHAALSGRYMLAELAGLKSTTTVASEFALLQRFLGPDCLVIALSQSGETIDVLEAARAARERGARVAALVNAPGSSLERVADLTVPLSCGPERCVLATKTYTAMLALLQLTAWTVAGERERGQSEIREAGRRVARLLDNHAVRENIRAVARQVVDHQHLFVLGRHRNAPSALEAALKIKEVTYLHAEGFPAGELKHGVIALVTNGTPCLVLAPDEDSRKEALAAAAEVAARGAFTVGLSPHDEAEFAVTLPVCGGPSAPYEVAALTQLLAYELALLLGCDPDKPRNLAKSVTVK